MEYKLQSDNGNGFSSCQLDGFKSEELTWKFGVEETATIRTHGIERGTQEQFSFLITKRFIYILLRVYDLPDTVYAPTYKLRISGSLLTQKRRFYDALRI